MAMNGLVKNSIFVDFKEWYLLIYCCYARKLEQSSKSTLAG